MAFLMYIGLFSVFFSLGLVSILVAAYIRSNIKHKSPEILRQENESVRLVQILEKTPEEVPEAQLEPYQQWIVQNSGQPEPHPALMALNDQLKYNPNNQADTRFKL